MLLSLEAILFDLDGVLVDSRAPIARSINHALERLGLAAQPEEALHARIGDSLHGVFVDLLGEQAGDPARAGEAMTCYREVYRDLCLRETRLVPGIAPLLEALADRHPLAVATTKPVEFALPILECLGVAERFRAVVGPGLALREAEPKRETARRALAALGLGPGARAALVGDRHHDVSAARALGIGAIGVTWGIGSEAELREAGAEWLVGAPGELARLLLGPAR
jgi:phosphoglycolate phosphatase